VRKGFNMHAARIKIHTGREYWNGVRQRMEREM